MAPVINVLNQWGAETPFTLPEENGVNVLAVSHKQITLHNISIPYLLPRHVCDHT